MYPNGMALVERKHKLSLNENQRKSQRKVIEQDNMKMAKKLAFARSAIPALELLDKQFRSHLRAKHLRCELPIVNMKKNLFSIEHRESRMSPSRISKQRLRNQTGSLPLSVPMMGVQSPVGHSLEVPRSNK